MEYLLSVIIPTYNCKEYLDATLGSVLQQLTEDEELIIVDDGSTFTDFETYDLAREKEMCIARSKIHPGEK